MSYGKPWSKERIFGTPKQFKKEMAETWADFKKRLVAIYKQVQKERT